MMAERGPFQSESEASRTEGVRAVYAAFDADPGPGKMKPHNVAMLTAACEAAGVILGAFDARQVEWLGTWEPHTCAVIAGLIIRAHETGKASAAEGSVAEWGARFRDGDGRLSRMVECGRGADGERTARSMAGISRKDDLTGIVLRREVGPWMEVPDA
jgi:hypothetical protein